MRGTGHNAQPDEEPNTEPNKAKDATAGYSRQVIKYLLVGGSSATLELLLFSLFVYILTLSLAISNISAIALATIYNFVLNRAWAFKTTRNLPRSLTLYALLFIFNNLFSTVAIVFLTNTGVLPVLAKMLTMACIVCWNFILFRKVIFKP